MHCSFITSASGAPQLVACPQGGQRVFLFDVGTGNMVGKFKALEESQSTRSLVRDPTSVATALLVSSDKSFVLDTRAKAISRTLVTTGSAHKLRFPANSGGKIFSYNHYPCSYNVVDYGTGKPMHTIPVPQGGQLFGGDMTGNCVVVGMEVYREEPGFHFFDLSMCAYIRRCMF
jgi:hypothetical protein